MNIYSKFSISQNKYIEYSFVFLAFILCKRNSVNEYLLKVLNQSKQIHRIFFCFHATDKSISYSFLDIIVYTKNNDIFMQTKPNQTRLNDLSCFLEYNSYNSYNTILFLIRFIYFHKVLENIQQIHRIFFCFLCFYTL
jgi:hypothetical protein